ncbi:1,4-alpha-glucan branching protein GlgB [Exilibacterium tricleocarpae]|uniref:1,4-alpha-glucan branching enzyme GlgB n=1 Tax=Exilibacterium tricleocarpae TaxID=2591008 RepID=A0A545TS69_9GAMM|nr:1,4-alpha-glucan branching protein GlgB [Exilibacterium tricleocarpae]TQV80059.1 1,4-alpha-glucan branching protein GlgB [Exilibacterium tricleocarpae]
MSVIPSNEAIQAINGASHRDPFAVLGMHGDGPGGTLVVRTFQPGAEEVAVLHADSGKTVTVLERVDDSGLFARALGRRKTPFPYRLRVVDAAGSRVIDDPYRFPVLLSDLDIHLFAEGTHLHLYRKLGAHPRTIDAVAGVAFAVWAPNAERVAAVGEFNGWDGRRHPMRLRHDCGIWELFIPGAEPGQLYKYEIKGPCGELLPLRSDPFGAHAQLRPDTASVIESTEVFNWSDQPWMESRGAHNARDAAMTIYEVHLGSWRRVPGEGDRFLTYRELAEQLVPYAKDMGFTHLQLMPVNEHPFDGSWGYQPVGLFAPSSRFGRPEDFQYLVDACHRAEIGLLIDWVPGHFPTDPHGLAQFDGTHLYEHADPRQGFHPDWNTLIYNYGRREVSNFLRSNAHFWFDRYHVDGLRVDAVASMLYLDYSREEGEWIPNPHGGNENLDAIDFLRRVNEEVYREYPGAFTVAEESTAWPGVSRPTDGGGLGFGYKWNMGWMNDTLSYMSRDPIHRVHHHNEMTFGLVYAFDENFVLPLSHDEVVHGKGSLLGRMPGDEWQKFANLRAYFGFMWTHPGKKLLFMGGEFAQGREWNHEASLDWHLLDIPLHAGVQRLVRDLNHLYRRTPALYQCDCESCGFAWLDHLDAESSIFAYLRFGYEGSAPVAVISNFTPVPRHGYRLGVPAAGYYAERLNTDAAVYGGSDLGNAGGLHAEPLPWQGQPQSLLITVPPLATLVFELQHAG